MSGINVWVVDDDASISWVLEKALTRAGYNVTRFDSGATALRSLTSVPADGVLPDLLLSDIRMDGMDGFELISEVQSRYPSIPVIIMTAYGDLDSAVDAYKKGAFEYLTKPFDINELVSLVERAVRETSVNSNPAESTTSGKLMLGDSPAMQEVFRVIGRLASSEMNVLVRGASGTGKELVANAIYRNSPRSHAPLVAINTAAIPAELLESELFGHERGAFTGARDRHIGRFEQANGGTLFLDEIGDMPPGLQTRLLRVLSEGRFFRVGGRDEVKVDVRVIAATNQNLEALVAKGEFRGDLFHRLNVISLTMPSLIERREDIPVLVQHFLSRAAAEIRTDAKQVAPDLLRKLQQYSWPGNVRELENLVRRLTVLAPSNTIQISDLPGEVVARATENESWDRLLAHHAAQMLQRGEQRLMQSLGAQFEAGLIKVALRHTGGHKQKAAELLGWGRNTLTRKMQQLNIDSPGKS